MIRQRRKGIPAAAQARMTNAVAATSVEPDVASIAPCPRKDITFFALIYLEVNGETVAIDARPSDAIALALRARAPIFVEESVIDNAKPFDQTADKTDADRLHKWLESLDPDDLGKYKM